MGKPETVDQTTVVYKHVVRLRLIVFAIMNDVDEHALARKLAAKWQLSVPERNSLTPAGIASSSLVEAIREILNESSCYPAGWSPDDAHYDGVVIIPTATGFRTHTRHEIGYQRFSDPTVADVIALDDAVRAFLAHVFSLDNVDGIPIDWTR